MVKRGYMDDPWNTDQAWREVELWHVHYNGNENLSQQFMVSNLCQITSGYVIHLIALLYLCGSKTTGSMLWVTVLHFIHKNTIIGKV